MNPTQPLLVLIGVAGLLSEAVAGPIVSPTSVSTNMATLTGTSPGIRLESIIDQSGLSSTYTSGVTDFDSFIGSNPSHDNGGPGPDFSSVWVAAAGTTAGQIDLGFGQTTAVQSLALWNRGPRTEGIREFDLLYSLDGQQWLPLGSFTATAGVQNPDRTSFAQVFEFGLVEANFLRMDIKSIYGTFAVSLSEVAVEAGSPTSAVPEPGTLVLTGLALSVLAGSRLRQRQST